MITILQLAGLDDSNQIQFITTDASGERRFLEFGWVSPLLKPLDPNRFQHSKLLYGGINNTIKINFKPDIVYNSISDPDRCTHTLNRVEQAAKNNPYPFINPPNYVLNTRKERLYDITKDIDNIMVPQCLRITPSSLEEVRSTIKEHNMQPPLLFQEAAPAHGATNRFLLESIDELHRLERFAFDGRAYYMRAFVDYRSEDGFYRKYRFFVIGNKILPGHLILSKEWEIKDDLQAHKTLGAELSQIKTEERAFLKAFQKRRIPALLALQERLGLDYFAVNCSFKNDGTLLLFDVSCGEHYLDASKEDDYYSPKQRKRFNEAVETMITNKLKAEGK